MITVIDYGMGNIGSIQNMLTRLGLEVESSSDIAVIERAEKLILPGVGAFDAAITNLSNRGLIPVLNRCVLEQHIPILGICLGMQLMSKRSEEGRLDGLGWVDADTVRMNPPAELGLRIPHMGWNTISVRRDSCLLRNLNDEPRFYFVHSYYMRCAAEGTVLATSHYGLDFACAIAQNNIYGVQFHPEKSHKFGMQVLRNYAGLC